MKKVFLLIVSIFIIGTMSGCNNEVDNIKSINLATDYEIEQVLKDIELVDANTVNVPVVINIDSLESSVLEIDEYSKSKAIELIKILNDKGINVLLEAFPWIDNGSKYETEYNPTNTKEFFTNWKNVLNVLIDDIANVYDVYILNTASNFNKLEHYEDEWCDIIDFTKSKFDGLVTYRTSWWYSANWDEESVNLYNQKVNNKLFSKVDFISIAAYFELSEDGENTVEQLINDLNGSSIYGRKQNIKEEIENFYKVHDKKIFFGELGFPRLEGAATHPWDMNVSDKSNDLEQARCFEAYRKVFEDEEFILGFSVFAMGSKTDDKMFYPSDDSIKIIKDWY